MNEVVDIVRKDLNCGICSNIWVVTCTIHECMRRNILCSVNFRDDFHTQFHDSNTYMLRNPWEDYFEQPFGIGLSELYVSDREQLNCGFFDFENCSDEEKKNVISRSLNPSLMLRAEISKISPYDIGSDSIGILLRGTDYRNMMPKEHPKQPYVGEIIRDVNSIKEKRDIKKLFVVTDEPALANEISDRTNLELVMHQRKFIDSERGKFNYDIMKHMSYDDKREINMEYLSGVFALSTMENVLLSYTSATVVYGFLRILNGLKPVNEKIYRIGRY